LIDDDEDVPTSAIVRADMSHSIAAVTAPPAPSQSASTLVPPDVIDEEPTEIGSAIAMPEPAPDSPPFVEPSASVLAPNASPRAMTQQLPAARLPTTSASAPTMQPATMAPAVAGVSIETPFKVSAPRVEVPKSKAGLIAGGVIGLLLLVGGGAAAVVTLNRQNTPAPAVANSSNPAQTSVTYSNAGAASTAHNGNAGTTVAGTASLQNAQNGTAGVAAENVANAANAANIANTATQTGEQGTAAPGTTATQTAVNPPQSRSGATNTATMADPANSVNANANVRSNTVQRGTTTQSSTRRRSEGTQRPQGGAQRTHHSGGDLFDGNPY
jgi:hypothetical protein